MRDILQLEVHREDLMRAAEKHRLVKRARTARGAGRRYSDRVLGWVGDQLVASGTYLQERHGERSASPKALPGNPAGCVSATS